MIAPLRKPERTAADTIAAAIAPLLIMLFVGSFVFYLFDLAYAGPHGGQLRWTLFWFVFAMVLVSRISMEESFARASGYGVVLAMAMAMWLFQFIDFVFGVLFLLTLIWWATSKLVWDCTLVRDDEDATGKGLLEVAGFSRPGEAQQKLEASQLTWWRKLFTNQVEKAGEAHASGLWVIYFAAAALPIFGLGYALLSKTDHEQRLRSFEYLGVFLVCALGLLLIGSFLGLRRYLRQRYLQMPGALTRSWIQSGVAFIMVVLLMALFLPRPESTYNVPQVLKVLHSPPLPTPKRSPIKQEGETGKAQNSSTTPDEKEPSTQKGGQEKGPVQAAAAQKPPGPSRTFSWIFVIGALWLLIRYWRVLVEFLVSLWRDFRGLKLNSLPDPHLTKAASAPPKQFGAYKNPFSSGKAEAWPLAETLVYTFRALEAWGRDHGRPRSIHQTPLEFGESLTEHFFALRSDVAPMVQAYSKWAYGQRPPEPELKENLESLWSSLSMHLAPRVK
jgi:hypothetical protein